MAEYATLFSVFTASLENFINEVCNKKARLMATKEWTVKDELCHIVFWHENYASNYKALAENSTPILPEGMSTINSAGVRKLRKTPTKTLISRLITANDSLYNSIVEKKVPEMTYSKGGRSYKTEDFLPMITRHINTHAKQVRRAKNLRIIL